MIVDYRFAPGDYVIRKGSNRAGRVASCASGPEGISYHVNFGGLFQWVREDGLVKLDTMPERFHRGAVPV
jgi:hypothetical protein